MLLFSEYEVDKSEISYADSIWTDEDEDLLKSDSTDGKNMMPLCITVQPDKQTQTQLMVRICYYVLQVLPDTHTYDKTTSAGLFPRVYLFGETLMLIDIQVTAANTFKHEKMFSNFPK